MNIFAIQRNSAFISVASRVFVALFIVSTIFSPVNHLIPSVFAQETEGTVETQSEEIVSQSEDVAMSVSTASSVTVDITASGSQGPVSLSQGQNLDLAWVSSNAVFCEMTSPVVSGVMTMGSDIFLPDHPWYPAESSLVTFSITCGDGMGNTASDSVVVSGPSAPVASSVDITANGSQGPVSLSDNAPFTLDWISANVVSCELSILDVRDLGSVPMNGSSETISDNHSFYPPAGGAHEFVINCEKSTGGEVTDSVVVTRDDEVVPAPVAPVLSAHTSSQCGGNVTLSWNAVEGATSYKVYRDGTLITTTEGTSFEDSGLTPSNEYAYSAIAIGVGGESEASQTVYSDSSDICDVEDSAVDITANGSQGPVSLSDNAPFTLDWISANVVSCELSILGGVNLGSVALNGTSGSYPADHQSYPAIGTSNTFVITCEGGDGVDVTDSITVSHVGVNPDAPVLSAQTSSQCGGKITLSWSELSNAMHYEVYRAGVSVGTTSALSYTDSNLNSGTSYSYTVVAHNGYGVSDLSNAVTAIASASCAPASVSVNITANGSEGPVVLVDDESFTLDWTSTNAISCNLRIQGGRDLGSVDLNGGSGVVKSDSSLYPAVNESRTFVLTCTGGIGQNATDSVTLTRTTVGKPPVAPVLSAHTSSQCGGNVTLSWNAVEGATSYKVYRDGALITTTEGTSFEDSGLTPRSGYEYKVKAVNEFGLSHASNTKTVLASGACAVAPVVFLTASPSVIQEGQTSKLTWTSNNATRCDAVWTTSDDTDGNKTVKPSTTTTYSITCTGPGGSATATATVTVNQAPHCPVPVIESDVVANGTVGKEFSYTIVASAQGTTTPITYSAYNLPEGLTLSGSVISGIPTKSGIYEVTIKARNVCGHDSDTLVIKIKKESTTPAISVDLTAQPLEIYVGATSTLSWISGNTTSCSAPWTSATTTSGSLLVSPATTTTYSITCTDGVRTGTDTVTIRVLPTPQCVLPEFTSPSSVALTVGSNLNYGVSATSTTDVSYSVVSTLPSWITFANNTLTGVPTETGIYDVTLKAQNTCGAKELVVRITVSSGGGGGNPISVDLVAQPETITLGATSTLSWISGNTTSCSAPWTSATTTSGSLLVSPATTTTYSITCTDGVRTGTDTVTITVVAGPQCVIPNITSNLTVSGKVGTAFDYTITSTSGTGTTTYAIATSTLPLGLSFANGVISGTPSASGTYTVQISAQNSCGVDAENLVITIANADTPPPVTTGGGGGGGKRGGFSVSEPEVLGVTECNYLRDYLNIKWKNDQLEMIKLQVFLRELEGFKNLPITGVFDQATFDAVAIFQERYKSDILTPWGHTQYTGFVYILTKKKVNEIVCQREFPLNTQQQNEIIEFRAFLGALEAQGVSTVSMGQGTQGHQGQNNQPTQTTPTVVSTKPVINEEIPNILSENGEEFAQEDDKGQEGEIGDGVFTTNENLRSIAVAIFAGPQGWEESWNTVLYFFVILCVLYILSTARANQIHNKTPLTAHSMKVRKIFWFIIGLSAFLFLSFLFGFYTIILPLFVTLGFLVVFFAWLVFKKKENRELIELPQIDL